MPKNKTGRKVSVLTDELDVKEGGLYCFLPFNRIDKHGKAVFKVGLATGSISHRAEAYHTYFPLGVWICAILEHPILPRALRGRKEMTKATWYKKIETFIFDDIIKKGGHLITSTTRVKNMTDERKGSTEWIYTSPEIIHDAFNDANHEFGGKLQIFSMKHINKIADREDKDTATYVGKIVYKVL